MPTERFLRLPKEKIEAIRIAAAKEFMRVPLEEASINRIVHDADISRGSFYTYFEDKQDLLKWLIYAQACLLYTSHSMTPPSSTFARFVFKLYIFFDQFSIVE